jgi:hypothetical protein
MGRFFIVLTIYFGLAWAALCFVVAFIAAAEAVFDENGRAWIACIVLIILGILGLMLARWVGRASSRSEEGRRGFDILPPKSDS